MEYPSVLEVTMEALLTRKNFLILLPTLVSPIVNNNSSIPSGEWRSGKIYENDWKIPEDLNIRRKVMADKSRLIFDLIPGNITLQHRYLPL